MIYSSLLLMFLGCISIYISSNKTSADETALMPVSVSINISISQAPADSHTNIPIDVAVSPDGYVDRIYEIIDHVSIYAARPGQKIDLTYSAENQTLLCSKIASGEITKISESMYQGDGTWSQANWEAPNTTGMRQVLGVAYASGTTCKPANLKGWSRPDVNSFINIYKATVSSGEIDLSTQSPIMKNSPLTVQASMEDPRGVDHISILILRQGTIEYENIAPETACYGAGQVRAIISCTAESCDGTAVVTGGLDQTGLHRVVALAMSSPVSTACAQANILSMNKENIITVTDATDPNGDGQPGGSENGGGDGSGTTFSTPKIENVTTVKTFSDVLTKINWVAYALTGIIVLSTLIFSGITYIVAAGDEEKVKRAKKAMVYGITSAVIIFLAYFIVSFSLVTIKELKLITPQQVSDSLKTMAPPSEIKGVTT